MFEVISYFASPSSVPGVNLIWLSSPSSQELHLIWLNSPPSQELYLIWLNSPPSQELYLIWLNSPPSQEIHFLRKLTGFLNTCSTNVLVLFYLNLKRKALYIMTVIPKIKKLFSFKTIFSKPYF